MSSPFSEYPKWVRSNGREVIVNDAEAEVAQLAAWNDEPVVVRAPRSNALLQTVAASFDHDGDGKPGGSTAPAEDVADLRKTYQAKFGKRPFPGWKADELKARIEAV